MLNEYRTAPKLPDAARLLLERSQDYYALALIEGEELTRWLCVLPNSHAEITTIEEYSSGLETQTRSLIPTFRLLVQTLPPHAQPHPDSNASLQMSFQYLDLEKSRDLEVAGDLKVKRSAHIQPLYLEAADVGGPLIVLITADLSPSARAHFWLTHHKAQLIKLLFH